jgi:hypothetical protein
MEERIASIFRVEERTKEETEIIEKLLKFACFLASLDL